MCKHLAVNERVFTLGVAIRDRSHKVTRQVVRSSSKQTAKTLPVSKASATRDAAVKRPRAQRTSTTKSAAASAPTGVAAEPRLPLREPRVARRTEGSRHAVHRGDQRSGGDDRQQPQRKLSRPHHADDDRLEEEVERRGAVGSRAADDVEDASARRPARARFVLPDVPVALHDDVERERDDRQRTDPYDVATGTFVWRRDVNRADTR